MSGRYWKRAPRVVFRIIDYHAMRKAWLARSGYRWGGLAP